MANVNSDHTKECAFEGCHCKIQEAEHPVTTAQGVFCCQGCAQGTGCEHSSCNCAQ
ncbi:metallothionein [Oceanisphaera avium]|nr:metallothionein [Oceanisphaera avium]